MVLSEGRRVAVQERLFKGYSSGTIAKMLKLSPMTVRNHILRIKELRKNYGECLKSLKNLGYALGIVRPPVTECDSLKVELAREEDADRIMLMKDLYQSLTEGWEICRIKKQDSFEISVGDMSFSIGQGNGLEGFCFLHAYSDLLRRDLRFK